MHSPVWNRTVLRRQVSKPVAIQATTIRNLIIVLVVATLAAIHPGTAHSNERYSGIVVDAKTGKVLYSDSAKAKRYPASLTKIMTLYLLFEELDAGRLKLDSRLKISKHAASQPPSKIGVRPGHPITVRTAIRALVIKSANDVAMVVAENISGSEKKFAHRMTQTAAFIGMKNTTFKNPHGLPNRHQRTTATDMAILGRAIQERFPKYYEFFSHRIFKFRGRTYSNTNRLLGRVDGVDGIKTGYIRASGFNLVASVRRNNRHIIAVVIGGRTSKRRNNHMEDLINRYLNKASKGNKTSYVLNATQRNPILIGLRLPKSKPVVNLLALVPENRPDQELTKLLNEVSEAGRKPRPSPNDRPAIQVHSNTQDSIESLISREQLAAIQPKPEENSTSIPTAEESKRATGGWQVQIAATPSKANAVELLQTAQSKVGSELQPYSFLTEPVKTKSGTHYRARFVGFASKKSANSACKSLKKAKFRCYAIFE